MIYKNYEFTISSEPDGNYHRFKIKNLETEETNHLYCLHGLSSFSIPDEKRIKEAINKFIELIPEKKKSKKDSLSHLKK